MTTEQINQQLLDDGWKQFPSSFREAKQGFAKSFEGHSECKCNKGKRKQIEIYFYPEDRISGHKFEPMWHVTLTGQLPDNEWLRMQVESLKNIETIYRTVGGLLSIWDYAVSITPYIEEPE
jgi:hypothetical protein